VEKKLYDEMYELEDRHWWFVSRQRIILDLLTRQLKLSAHARILDVGCGTGAVLADLSKRYEAYGTDTSELAVEYCRKRGLANVYRCELEGFPLEQLRFDLVTLLDVIEHVDDDVRMLRGASDRLAPGGRILVTVPAYQFLWGPHDVANHHKRRYTRDSLKRTMQSSGLTIEKISYMNFLLFPVALVQRLLVARRPGDNGNMLHMPAKPLNTVLTFVFAFERQLLRMMSLPYGLSLLAIARKG
jgi:SAM-dependent methyltransferase